MDRLSDLPEHLLLHALSFLPTNLAARTSSLSRRFRHLWELTTSLDLSLASHPSTSSFINAADRALLDRDGDYSLHRLNLDLNVSDPSLFEAGVLTFGYVNILLVRAGELNVQQLTVDHLTHQLDEFLPTVLSIASLRGLSLRHLSRCAVFPPVFAATGLRFLSLTFDFVSFKPAGLNPFLAKLASLEELELEVPAAIDLRSETVKRLKLRVVTSSTPEVGIRMPKLEVLDFLEWRCRRTDFHGEMPLLRKAKIHFMYPWEEGAPAIWKMLKAVRTVEELRVMVIENHGFKPFHTMVEPEADPPQFPNLKHLDLEMCFHDRNKEDLIILLRNSPAIESLKLVDKPPRVFKTQKERWRSGWWCMLPPNSEGFHVGEAKTKLVQRLLRKKPTRKRKYYDDSD